jgi:hypothetical protein
MLYCKRLLFPDFGGSLRLIPIALLLVSLGVASSAEGQALGNSEFQMESSPEGLRSLKRTHDEYDTNYIAPGRTLGDIFVRYRTVGEREWKKASAATIDSGAAPQDGRVSFTIGALVPTIASSARVTASISSPAVMALNDGIVPQHSGDEEIPRFTWFGREGTTEWVQYDFAQDVQVTSAQVTWATLEADSERCKLPKSWRVLYRDGENWKAVNEGSGYPIEEGRENRVSFAVVSTRALRIEAQLQEGATAGIFEWRVNDEQRQVTATQDLQARESFRLEGKNLLWTISLRNLSSQPLEVGDLALPLQFNTQYVWNRTETYTKRLIPHSFVGGNGSFLFWMRTNGVGPYLVLTPVAESGFEYFEPRGSGRGVAYYIHSSASGEELRARGGTWRLPNSKMVLKPTGQSGDAVTYQFRFRWAQDYAAVRDVLHDQGVFDVNVVPGMTVPTDLSAMFSVRTLQKIRKVEAEYPDSTKIEYAGEHGADVHVYKVHFSHLGENLLTLRYGNGAYLALEFFVTEPLETLFQKRASFLVSHEQVHDRAKWYQTVFSQWDMKKKVLRSPEDLDGLQSYAVASDDPALGKAPYVAGKNVFYPSQSEIDAVESYIRDFVWGGLQQTDKDPYPYAIYGIPNWKVNRESPQEDQTGKKHIWRIYDYPHIILLYYDMYQIAKLYPGTTKYLHQDGYLERAFGTAKAFFTVPYEITKWSAYETGTYNELVIPNLIDALNENGHRDQAEWLKIAWEKKVKYFVNDHPYLFGSEYPFDSTGFESTHAFAKYALSHARKPGEPPPTGVPADDFGKTVKYEDAEAFLEEQMKLNVACRGWLETAYYYLGSDYRGSGPSSYTLSYMAQMGGWAVSDYALYYAHDPMPYLRLGYASYLSSWALLNSGTPESNYGYWFPGKENDGGAGGGFEPRPWGRAWLGNKEMGRGSWWYSGEIDLGFDGALRTAATIAAEDPTFGWFAYGGDLTRTQAATRVIPKDGLRTRFHVIRGDQRVHILLGRDGFAKNKEISFDDSLHAIRFMLENRGTSKHQTEIQVSGLPVGTYEVRSNKDVRWTLAFHEGETKVVRVPVDTVGATVVLTRVSAVPH